MRLRLLVRQLVDDQLMRPLPLQPRDAVVQDEEGAGCREHTATPYAGVELLPPNVQNGDVWKGHEKMATLVEEKWRIYENQQICGIKRGKPADLMWENGRIKRGKLGNIFGEEITVDPINLHHKRMPNFGKFRKCAETKTDIRFFDRKLMDRSAD